jgi:hypothetical protein
MTLSYLHYLQCYYQELTTLMSTSQQLSCPQVNNFGLTALHAPEPHWTSVRCIGTYLHDPMAPPGVILMPIFRRLGTGSFSISSVV